MSAEAKEQHKRAGGGEGLVVSQRRVRPPPRPYGELIAARADAGDEGEERRLGRSTHASVVLAC